MIAGLFPGQGLEPGVVLAALLPRHELLDRATPLLGYDLRRKVEQVARRSRSVLPTDVAQPAIYVAGLIGYERKLEDGTRFDFLAGHSLGEYTALVASGSIAFSHGLRLVAARGAAMKRAASGSNGGMAAVMGPGVPQIEALCERFGVAIANDNSPKQAVVSGNKEALADLAAELSRLGGRTVLLPVDGAYHTDAMKPAAALLSDALDRTEVRTPSLPVVGNVSAVPYRSPGEIRKLLLEQLTQRVRFRESVEWLADKGVTDFIDLGPGRVVGRLASACIREAVHA